jgi:hypothetical protein
MLSFDWQIDGQPVQTLPPTISEKSPTGPFGFHVFEHVDEETTVWLGWVTKDGVKVEPGQPHHWNSHRMTKEKVLETMRMLVEEAADRHEREQRVARFRKHGDAMIKATRKLLEAIEKGKNAEIPKRAQAVAESLAAVERPPEPARPGSRR